mmetsp:Transcript_2011/g.4537  ORF Transcript_2011/g.4537 Transcript_2011/m.4537 type:complete len:107 (+) Transcript_2011:337-657(+)
MARVKSLEKELEDSANANLECEKRLIKKAEEVRLVQLEAIVRASRHQKNSNSPRKDPLRVSLQTPSAPVSPNSSTSLSNLSSRSSHRLLQTPPKKSKSSRLSLRLT